VAKELYALKNTFFTGKVKHDTLAGLRPYAEQTSKVLKRVMDVIDGLTPEKTKFLG
jgi:hypothetical protein